MTIRLRLIFGYGYLVGLLLVVAGSAIVGFSHLRQTIERIAEVDLSRIRATVAMVEALERQDSVTLSLLLAREPDLSQLEPFDEAFQRAFHDARAVIASESDLAVLERMSAEYQEYIEARAGLLDQMPTPPLDAYERHLAAAFHRVRNDAFLLLEQGHQSVLEAEQKAKQTAIHSGIWLGFIAALAMASVWFLSRVLQRDVLSRLQEYKAAAQDLSRGESRRRITVVRNDELGTVGNYLNTALDSLEQVRADMEAEVTEQRQLLDGLLAREKAQTALLDTDGYIIATTATGENMRWIEVAAHAVTRVRRDRSAGSGPVEPPRTQEVQAGPGQSVHLEGLFVKGIRQVGWLATLVEGPG